jgi:hypothetical protein
LIVCGVTDTMNDSESSTDTTTKTDLLVLLEMSESDLREICEEGCDEDMLDVRLNQWISYLVVHQLFCYIPTHLHFTQIVHSYPPPSRMLII